MTITDNIVISFTGGSGLSASIYSAENIESALNDTLHENDDVHIHHGHMEDNNIEANDFHYWGISANDKAMDYLLEKHDKCLVITYRDREQPMHESENCISIGGDTLKNLKFDDMQATYIDFYIDHAEQNHSLNEDKYVAFFNNLFEKADFHVIPTSYRFTPLGNYYKILDHNNNQVGRIDIDHY